MQTIKAQAWYRIPLVGGFTDYPDYYKHHGASSICCAINRFITVSAKQNHHGGVDIQSRAELPSEIGLGSSGAYYSALVSALAALKRQKLSSQEISSLAYRMENGIEDHATGRQDSVACLSKGITMFTYFPDDSVKVDRIPISEEWKRVLARRLLLFDTGVRRRARDSIKDVLSRRNTTHLHEIAKLPRLLLRNWNSGNLDFLAQALDLQEHYRSQLSPSCQSRRTDRLLRLARAKGAGARLAGAGLGCLVCYCPEANQNQLRYELDLSEIKFHILW